MKATTTVPLQITPEAEAYLDQFSLREPFERIIEHIRKTIPGLYLIEVTMPPPWQWGGAEIMLIEAVRLPSGLDDDPTDWNFGRWMAETFSGDVLVRLVVVPLEVPPDAR